MSCKKGRVNLAWSLVQNAIRPEAHKNETTATRNQFTMKLSLLVLVLHRLEASSASPPQRIRSADRDTAKAPAMKFTASNSGVPLGVGPDQNSRQRLLEVGLDYYSMSYGSEPVGSMPLSYDFSMSYPTIADPFDLETPFSEYLRNHFDNVARCAGVEMDVRGGCVFEHLLDLMLGVEDQTAAGGVRRMLQQEEASDSPCDQPNEAAVNFIVSSMLVGARDKCTAMGVDPENVAWDKATSDLVDIFTSPECWGMSPCNDDNGKIDENSDSGNIFPTTTSATTTAITTTATTTATTSAATATTTHTLEEDTTHTPVDSNEATMPVVDDGGVTSGNYELSSTTSTSVPEDAPADEPTEGTTIHDAYQHVPEGVSRIHPMASLIAAAGGLVAISLLFTGFYRMKNAKGGTQDGIIHPDEKSVDGQSTASHTMDSASSVESVELGGMVSVELGEMMPTPASVQPNLSYLDHSRAVWQ